MALWKYLRNKDCSPVPRGSLSTVVPAKGISSANKAVCCEIEVCRLEVRNVGDLIKGTYVYMVLNLGTDPTLPFNRSKAHLLFIHCLVVSL